MRILIVEDNVAIAANLYDYLEARGHNVEAASDGQMAFQLASKFSFDVILLDLSLPRMDGITLCHKLREELCADTPILMLTARDTLEDKLKGFQSGADDYLVKPFELEEVDARLHALHKRHAGKVISPSIQVHGLVFDARKKVVTFAGTEVALPPKCVRLLGMLISDPGRLFSRQELEIEIWGEEQDTSERLRHHLHLLRRLIVQAGGRDPIKTVHGLGYRLAEEDETV